MERVRLSLSTKKLEDYNGDLLALCADQTNDATGRCHLALIDNWLEKAAEIGAFAGKEGEKLFYYPLGEKENPFAARRILIVGIGKFAGDESPEELRERCRLTGGHIALQAAGAKARKVLINLPDIAGLHPGEVVECLTEGVLLGDYRFLKYKSVKEGDEESFVGLSDIRFHVPSVSKALNRGLRAGQVAALAAREARDMAHEPGNGWTPSHFAEYARKLAKKYDLKCTVLEKADMKRLGMGGLLAVNQGSAEPPRMVILEYRPQTVTSTLLVVGKGLTFDSGGVSLKPAAGMEEMKYDMCGGAAAMALMQAIGEERPNLAVVVIVPSTDNMAGAAALKPGDIITHYNGITSEVVNTDAEGRLILADALAYGIEKFTPDYVVDLATLTGAVIVGLGHHCTGLLGNDDGLAERLLAAGARCGEPLWRLPMGKEYSKQIESKVADIKNTGGKSAGTITAAAYLEKFVGKTPWAHLDIAGTAWDFTEKSYVPSGPSGIGVRTLLELVRGWKKGKLSPRNMKKKN